MSEIDSGLDLLASILRECTEEVLGAMLFAGIVADTAIQVLMVQTLLTKTIQITGPLTGRFRFAITVDEAQVLAADFLGLQVMPDSAAVDQVMGELANMICSAALSRIEPEALFGLSHPEPDSTPIHSDGSFQCFELERGLLAVSLELE